MKKEKIITAFLLLGLSLKSFAGTGNVNDGFVFLLVILSVLLILFFLFAGVDFLQKNGRTMINHTVAFFNKVISFFINHINRLKSKYLDVSYI